MKRLATVSIVVATAIAILGCGGLDAGDLTDIVPVDGMPVDADEPDEDDVEDQPADGDEPEGDVDEAPADEDKVVEEPEGDLEEPDKPDAGEPDDDGSATAPEPKPSADPKPARSGANVAVKGDGKVVLVGGGARYPVPGKVPPGSYDIEVSFNGAKAVTSGKVKVGDNGATVNCKASMGLCRSQ